MRDPFSCLLQLPAARKLPAKHMLGEARFLKNAARVDTKLPISSKFRMIVRTSRSSCSC